MNESSTKKDYKMKIHTNFKASSVANDVEISIPAACDLYNPVSKPTGGTAKYSPDRDCFVWKIPVFKGEQSHYIEYKYSLPTLISRTSRLFYLIEFIRFIFTNLSIGLY